MIIDIPTSEDFYISGKELLDFAWNIVVAELLSEIDYVGSSRDIDQNELDAYWRAAKRKLSTALSITQQGVEFILKGKIADVSVFILIAGDPSKWPSSSQENIKFSQFRMLDAQDLIKVHNMVSKTSLPESFTKEFNQLRETRNSIIHSIDKNLNIRAMEVVNSILFMHKYLFPNETWGQVRKEFLLNDSSSQIEGTDHVINTVCTEIALIFKLLDPAKVKTYFGIDKKQRKYFCPECYIQASHDCGFDRQFKSEVQHLEILS